MENQLKVKAPEGFYVYLTPNKIYNVIWNDGVLFKIIHDEGKIHCCKKCAYKW
jgi:hypothetical protein